jgi:methionine-S-sulfoxide reductase
MTMKKAYFSAGCFWGVEYYFKRLKGVTKTAVGFMGGDMEKPSYKQVKTGTTGHLETIEVTYDPEQASYEALVRYFFEIHDFEQVDGQGIDIGTQYLSAIWFNDTEERDTAIRVFGELMQMGYNPVTQIRQTMPFYPAEDYHQDYLDQRQETPECHVWRKIF